MLASAHARLRQTAKEQPRHEEKADGTHTFARVYQALRGPE
jgi:hypothetical protein